MTKTRRALYFRAVPARGRLWLLLVGWRAVGARVRGEGDERDGAAGRHRLPPLPGGQLGGPGRELPQCECCFRFAQRWSEGRALGCVIPPPGCEGEFIQPSAHLFDHP